MSDTSPKPGNSTHLLRLAGQIAHLFIQSKLTPLVIVGALLLGTFSILRTPREEDELDAFRLVREPTYLGAGRTADATRPHTKDAPA